MEYYYIICIIVKPYKVAWMNHADGMTFTTAGLGWFLVASDDKINSIMFVGLVSLGLIFIAMYHTIYKCINSKKY